MPNSSLTTQSASTSSPRDADWFSLLNKLAGIFFINIRTDADIASDAKLYKPEDVYASVRSNYAGRPDSDDIERRYKTIMEAASHMASESGLPTPEIRLSQNINDEAKTSKEGNNYIFLDKVRFAEALKSDDAMKVLLTTIGHEMAHLSGKDMYPINNIGFDQQAIGRKHETLADLVGGGPLMANEYTTTINHFVKDFARLDLTMYNLDVQLGNVPGPQISSETMTLEQFKQVSDHLHKEIHDKHPSTYDRVAYLQRAVQLQKEYEANHVVSTHEDKLAESKWIVSRVMHEIETNTLPPPTLPAFPPSGEAKAGQNLPVTANDLPEKVRNQAQGMEPLPMKDVDGHAPSPALAGGKQRARD